MNLRDIKIEKNNFQIFSSFADADDADRKFWHAQEPNERLSALELMRQSAYGYENSDTERLQRVFEITAGK